MSHESSNMEEKTDLSFSENVTNNKTEMQSKGKRWENDTLMITTLLAASLLTFLIYTVPDWVFIEIPTRNIIHNLLGFLGIYNTPIPTMDVFNPVLPKVR